jgi:hypothetical protein
MATIVQWELSGDQAQLADGARVTLRNRQQNDSVQFGEREYGIELVWDDATDLGNVTIRSQQAGTEPIAYATAVAIAIDGGGFLRYAEREYGINLVWSATPRFEWEITGGIPGTPVRLNRAVALLNTAHGDHLIYDERPYGINLRWYADLDLSRGGTPPGNFVAFGGYPPLPIPNALRAPGREAAQAQIGGEARRVTLFHGRSDDELDWHIYIAPDVAARRALAAHLRAHARGGNGLDEGDFDRIYCELMVLDGWRNPRFDEFFFSADVRRALHLQRPAWDYSEDAGNDQGNERELTGQSGLASVGARVYLQGPFVNDAEHGLRPEIHPLDSIAYALVDGAPLAVGQDDPSWPATGLTWRVAVFANSTFHRINRADYQEQERTTTWLLDLPRAAQAQESETGSVNQVHVDVSEPGLVNRSYGAQGLDGARPTAALNYVRYGVLSADHAIVTDPALGRRQLRVRVRMDRADRWGGMYLAEYRIRFGPPVIDPR